MDERTFDALYEAHAPGLFGFLAYRTGNRALAEGLLADTFERAVKARRPFDGRRGKAKTRLYSIALNLLRDSARSPAEHNGHLPHEQLEVRQIVMTALQTLDGDEREALALRYGADLSLDEIGKVIGERRSTVESRIHRGLRQLRLELSGDGELVPGPSAGRSRG